MSKQINRTSKPISTLPKAGEKILNMLLCEENRDSVIGDFEEGYRALTCEFNQTRALWWFCIEIVNSFPILFVQFIKNQLRRVKVMKEYSFYESKNKLATIGLISVIPALLLVTSGILQSAFGLTEVSDSLLVVDHPVIILGGLMLALALNILPIIKIKWQAEDGSLVGMIRLKGRLFNIMITFLSLFLVSLIFLYLFVENFDLVATHPGF